MYYPHLKQDFIDRINAEKEKPIHIAKEINNKAVIQMDNLKNRDSEEKKYIDFHPIII